MSVNQLLSWDLFILLDIAEGPLFSLHYVFLKDHVDDSIETSLLEKALR